MEKRDGGPAFPRLMGNMYGIEAEGGLSIRDYFAGQALMGLLAGALRPHVEGKDASTDRSAWAESAYLYADAMLAERSKDA